MNLKIMWSKTFKPGDGKAKRDVAMSAQVLFSTEILFNNRHLGFTNTKEES